MNIFDDKGSLVGRLTSVSYVSKKEGNDKDDVTFDDDALCEDASCDVAFDNVAICEAAKKPRLSIRKTRRTHERLTAKDLGIPDFKDPRNKKQHDEAIKAAKIACDLWIGEHQSNWGYVDIRKNNEVLTAIRKMLSRVKREIGTRGKRFKFKHLKKR